MNTLKVTKVTIIRSQNLMDHIIMEVEGPGQLISWPLEVPGVTAYCTAGFAEEWLLSVGIVLTPEVVHRS
jgi:hypothetical protein